MNLKLAKKLQVFMKFKNSFCIPKTDIDVFQTLACGQIFSYKEIKNCFWVYSADKVAVVQEYANYYLVQTDNIEYFKHFFDLETDYESIKTNLLKFDVMKQPIAYGKGIRILKQDVLETIISFVISANNNIKRIKGSVFYLREHFGENLGGYFAFPSLKRLATLTEQDFRDAGAGYRSPQLVKLINELQQEDYLAWGNLPTETLKNKLVSLSGIGPKVADCIMLFAYGKTDVFPVDTWIEKVYNTFFEKCTDRKKIRRELVDKFKNLSGFAQQYLFFYQRENKL